jgi:hypothetical protein
VPKFVTEAIVCPRRVLWHAGAVHLSGARLTLADEDFDALHTDGIVALATPENVAAVVEAIEQGLPVPDYVAAGPDDTMADPGFTARTYAHVMRDASHRRRVPITEAIRRARATASRRPVVDPSGSETADRTKRSAKKSLEIEKADASLSGLCKPHSENARQAEGERQPAASAARRCRRTVESSLPPKDVRQTLAEPDRPAEPAAACRGRRGAAASSDTNARLRQAEPEAAPKRLPPVKAEPHAAERNAVRPRVLLRRCLIFHSDVCHFPVVARAVHPFDEDVVGPAVIGLAWRRRL